MSRVLPWLLLLPLLSGCASETVEREPDELTRLEVELKREDGYETRWQLAAACLDVIDVHPDIRSGTKLSYAKRALKHADQAVRIDEERVEGHYYRAIALGRVLEFETLPDLDRIGELEQAAERARAIDPTFKHAGPLRFLALLYTKAPPWPIGPELAGEEDEIEALNLGIIAAYYYIQYTTIELLASSLTAKTKLKGLLEIVSSASEFDDLPMRPGEQSLAAAH